MLRKFLTPFAAALRERRTALGRAFLFGVLASAVWSLLPLIARDLGLSLAAWTVDEPEAMRHLIALGCDALCTDRPDRLRAVISTDGS